MNTTLVNDTPTHKLFSIVLSVNDAQAYFSRAATALSFRRPIKGFRPGQAPFDVVSKALSYNLAYEEVAKEVLAGVLPKFLEEQTIHRLGDPRVEFKTLEKGKAIVIEVTLALWPAIELPDYKKITVANTKPEVSDQEISQALEYLKKARKAQSIDDALAQSLGTFKNLKELRESIRQGIVMEKTNAALEKARGDILEKVREKSNVQTAPFLVEREAQKLFDSEQEHIRQSGMNMEDYLARIGKTKEQYADHIKDLAKKRLQNALILNEIAKREHLEVSEQEIEERLTRVLSHFSSPQEAQKQFDPATIKQRLGQQLLEEKVFSELLDKQIITN